MCVCVCVVCVCVCVCERERERERERVRERERESPCDNSNCPMAAYPVNTAQASTFTVGHKTSDEVSNAFTTRGPAQAIFAFTARK